MNYTSNFKVETTNGPGEIKDIYITELGYILVKVYFKDKMCLNYTIGKIDDILENNSKIKLVK